MKPKISWSKIWTEVAVAFERPEPEKTQDERDFTGAGLCYAIKWLTDESINVYEIFNYGQDLFKLPLRYWWPFGSNSNSKRATYAGLMAAIGYKEFKRMFCNKDTERYFEQIEKNVEMLP